MLKRIFIDNYKSLINFEIKLNNLNLFLGRNGSGKSAIFEVLDQIRRFVYLGEDAGSVFPIEHKTRWSSLSYQKFELEFQGHEGIFKYELSLKHSEAEQNVKVRYERLFYEGNPLLKLEEKGEVHLFRDDFSHGPVYPVNLSLSAVGAIPPRNDNTLLTWFKNRIKHLIVLQIIPPMMSLESSKEAENPFKYLTNFTSWYRYLSQDQGLAFQLISELKNVIPGFYAFKFESVGEKHRLLKVAIQNEEDKQIVEYTFDELSDGQRMLISLYTILVLMRLSHNSRYILCLDEPENFLALEEIQPWLTELYDICENGHTQAILISHHPELIDYLLADPVGFWFERESNRATRIKSITIPENKKGIPFSEIIARGWLNE
ncbi:ATPase-like protein [Desulfamplus magnetovallimortis]|uniref:ATPase-like protein n=1 Tax=Desulfamplus magnetovallimortis TaxID=1246637 RepID=A0A1W1HI22_9BACT|nr:ATP-binding protein [Desulfamplus magnetovallimortis]SLM32090.1 ATPase-like protein [Desulfamplus magnetovallimortis]